uniref:Uncharacterized protein n=1 Tax=Romanomermis culicivorax TaxID=13658 RepID=A0A915KT64_ROMCU
MNNIKKSGMRIPNRVTVKKLSNNQKARIATSNIAIADRCKAVRQSVHNNLIDKIRGLDIIDNTNIAGAERKEIIIDCSNKSMTSSPKDKEAIFKEQFQQYLKRKDEKTAMERNFFAKHPPFYVGGLKNAKLNAKSASSAIKQFESQNLECQKQINSIANKQEAPLVSCSTFTVNASNDEIPSIDNKHEPTQANCLSNTFSTHDCSKSNASDSNSNDEAVFQKASSANVLPEKAVETIVNVRESRDSTKYILKLESPQNSDLSVQVKFENIFEIRRSNRKTRYTGSFTAMATASDTKRRRSRSIGSRTSIVLTP